jgi:nucleoside phosphorylase
MGTAREDFLAQFDSDVYPFVIEYAKAISEFDSDVLMFTARKAACLFDAMRSVGLTASTAQIVSTRVLDMDPTWLAGKTVTLVDDVLITGTSLHSERKKLLAAGASKVEVVALAVNTDWWVEELAAPTNNYISLSDSRALNLCSQIVDAIGVVPRPYNLDWPLYDALRLPTDSTASIGMLSGWITTDTTTSVQSTHDVFSVTSDALPSVRSRLEDEIGLDLAAASLMKVRVYGRVSDADSAVFSLRVVPILAFDDLHIDDVDRLFESVIRSAENLSRYFTTSASRLRLVQYVLAARLGHLWMDDLVALTGIEDIRHVEDNQLAFAFTPEAAGAARQLSSARIRYSSVRLRKVQAEERVGPEAGVRQVEDVWELQDLLTEPFRQMYFTKELPTRRQYKKYGAKLAEDAERAPMLNRLEEGDSVGELVAQVAAVLRLPPGASGEDAARRLVSGYLDSAIDHGVVVPITQIDGNIVRRSFRHGEDIVFADNEVRLFGIMLKSVFERAGINEIDKVVAEKLCVIFVRIGIFPLEVLTRFDKNMGRAGTVGIRANLYGAVVQSDAHTMFGSREGNGLGKLLERRLTLESASRESYRFGKVYEHAATSPNADSHADDAGILLGQLFEPGRKGKPRRRPGSLTDDDLVILATCINPAITAAALGAELFIFNRDWGTRALRIRTLEKGRESAELEALDRSSLARGIRSGLFKFQAYRDDKPQEIIDRVSNHLTERRDRNEWLRWWDQPVGEDSEVVPELTELIDRQAEILLRLEVNLSLVRAGLRIKAGDDPSAVASELNSAVGAAAALQRSAPGDLSDGESHRVVEVRRSWRESGLDVDELMASALAQLDAVRPAVTGLLDHVNTAASHWGRPRSVRTFNSAVHVVVEGPHDEVQGFKRDLTGFANKYVEFRTGNGKLPRFAPLTIEGLPDGLTWIGAGWMADAILDIAVHAARGASSDLHVRIYLMPSLREIHQVYSAGTEYRGAGFADYLTELVESDQTDPLLQRSRIVVASAQENPVSRYAAEAETRISEKLASQIVNESDRARDGGRIKAFMISERPSIATIDRADIGIVTMLDQETRAVNEWMDSFGATETKIGAKYFRMGTTRSGSRELKLVSTTTVAPGTNSAMIAFANLVANYRPRILILLGIAGSVSKLTLGDVVIASSIIDYGPAADTESGLAHRGDLYKMPAAATVELGRYFSGFPRPRLLQAGPAATQLKSPQFALAMDPIGTGPLVIKNSLSTVVEWLKVVNDKTSAVETEASAIGAYFHEEASAHEIATFVVLRGISDRADIVKDDQWHFAASENAVLALRELLPVLSELLPAD